MIQNLLKLLAAAVSAAAFALSITCIVYSIRYFDAWGIPDYKPYLILKDLKWGLLALFGLLLVVTSPLSDFLVSLFMPIRKISLREMPKAEKAIAHVQELYYRHYGKRLRIRLKIVDAPYPGGMSFGLHTIAITTGLLNNFTEEEITAVIAHEAGHLHHKDSAANLLALLCSRITYGIAFMLVIFFMGKDDRGSGNNVIDAIPLFIFFWIVLHFPYNIMLAIGLSVAVLPLNILHFCTAWPAEYRADRFAASLGLSAGMIRFLEHLQATDIRDRNGFLSYFNHSHPPVALRIDKIERRITQKSRSLESA